MKVDIIREEPQNPPIREVVITITSNELYDLTMSYKNLRSLFEKPAFKLHCIPLTLEGFFNSIDKACKNK